MLKNQPLIRITNPISRHQHIVILITRYDRTPEQRVAWWYKAYPDGIKEYAAPEDELSPLDNP